MMRSLRPLDPDIDPLSVFIPHIVTREMTEFLQSVGAVITEQDIVIDRKNGKKEAQTKTIKFSSQDDLALFVLMFEQPRMTSFSMKITVGNNGSILD